MRLLRLPFRSFVAVVAILAAVPVLAAEAPVDFGRDVRPILSTYCLHCHGPAEETREAELRLDVRDSAVELEAIVPQDVAASELVARITTDDPELRMPPPETKKSLKPAEIETLKRWIEQGAEYAGHWSFETPTSPEIPEVAAGTPVRNPIDRFVAAGLKAKGLTLSPEADRATLLRRVTFDLTGLPPTLAEIEAFEQDTDPNAYEKVVDRLLKSPHYGERMALAWMDAARYGDTSVFHADGPRDMWYWRDWVIRSYNENKPFDDFTIEQLAGDLIPDATVDQIAATAFHRNHGTTDEGGAIDEEYRVEYIVDRVKTTGTIWLGLTLECGQCHSHKYDPISQRDYYRFYAFFNQSADRGMQTRRGNAAPKIDIPNREGERQAELVRAEIAKLNEQLAARSKAVEPEFTKWAAELTAKADGEPLVPTDTLLHFPFDEGKGNTVADAKDGEQKGTFKGKLDWVDGRFGKALKFPGNAFVEVAGDVANFERTSAFSYGAWINVPKNASGTVVSRMDDGNAYRGWDLLLQGGKLAMHLVNTWPSNALKVSTKKALEGGKWHHVCVTYDGSSKAAGVTIYVDGEPWEWNIEQNGLTETTISKAPLSIGRRTPGSPLKGTVDDVRIYGRKLSASEVGALAGSDPLRPIFATKPEERTPEQIATLRSHFLSNVDKPYQQLTKQIAQRDAKIVQLTKPLTSVMVLKEQMRPTYLLMRGHYASPDKEEVLTPDTPPAFPPMKPDLPKNRLGLAKWLVDRENPLTARVTVNRYWQMLFGRGIVETMEDFGTQGAYPTHPELLDWLAVDFVENGWDVKRTLKQIVMSHTYRQSSRITPQLAEVDPLNEWLARGPRFRLQGEFVRDNALAVAGLLVKDVGGPGVKPYQPPGLWNEVSLSGNVRFKADSGPKLFRRSMYTYWKRSAPAPSLTIFDAPTRETCVVRRPRTNTPLQALVTLNDPQFVEAARVLAQRMLKEGGTSPEDRIRFAYRLATAHEASSLVVNVLEETYETELKRFQSNLEAAKKLVAIGESPRDETLDLSEHAAWSIVASMILNLDAVLTRG